MSSSVTCPNCGDKFETSYLFCPTCNSNLTLPEKVTMKDISYKDDIDEEYIVRFDSLKTVMDDLNWVDYEEKKQEQLLTSLRNEDRQLQSDIREMEKRVDDHKSDVEELQRMSWKSFKAKIIGKHDKILSNEQEEYLLAVQDLESARDRHQKVKKRLKTVKRDMIKIKEAKEARQKVERKIKDLIYTATDGIKDKEEDRIELEINRLGQTIDPLTVRKSRIQTGYSFLQMASEYLREATINIEEDDELVVKQNALLIDLLTKSEVSGLKKQVKEATSYLDQAYSIMQEELVEEDDLNGDGEQRGLFEGKSLWEQFMRNFMKDLKSGFRTKEQTKEQLTKATGDINKLMSWVNSLLTDINYRISDLMEELKNKEQDLVRERHRIFMEKYTEKI